MINRKYYLLIPTDDTPVGTTLDKVNSLWRPKDYVLIESKNGLFKLVHKRRVYGYPITKWDRLLGWFSLAIPAALLAKYLIKKNRKHFLIPVLKKYYFQMQYILLFKKKAIKQGLVRE